MSESLTEVFDRLSVPTWIREALTEVVAEAWDEGHSFCTQLGELHPNPYRTDSWPRLSRPADVT